VVNKAHFLFDFELRGLKFNDAKVVFYIKSVKGLKLPEITQWRRAGSTGRGNARAARLHKRPAQRGRQIQAGDGEPPPDAERYEFYAAVCCRVCVIRRWGFSGKSGRKKDGMGEPKRVTVTNMKLCRLTGKLRMILSSLG
jgi:hypothetical protein